MAHATYEAGLSMSDLKAELGQFGPWNVEKKRSSHIELLPFNGLIKKSKERRLDKTQYEAFATLFFSRLLQVYGEFLDDKDFTLYAPQIVRIEYGDETKENSLDSRVYQFFCPGTPFNKLNRGEKKRDYAVHDAPARLSQRVAYLTGLLSEIFRKEGVMHGDLALRHCFLLPKDGKVARLNRDKQPIDIATRNGIGVIDVENARYFGEETADVKKEMRTLKERVMKGFPSKRMEEYYDKGVLTVTNGMNSSRIGKEAYEIAQHKFHSLFKSAVKGFDMEEGRVHYL